MRRFWTAWVLSFGFLTFLAGCGETHRDVPCVSDSLGDTDAGEDAGDEPPDGAPAGSRAANSPRRASRPDLPEAASPQLLWTGSKLALYYALEDRSTPISWAGTGGHSRS
jgi:hypothetical protein